MVSFVHVLQIIVKTYSGSQGDALEASQDLLCQEFGK